MFKQIAEFYGLYLEKDLGVDGPKKWVLGDYQGNSQHIDIFAITMTEFRALCEQMNPYS